MAPDTPRPRVLIADDYGPMVDALERLVSFDCDVIARLADGGSLLAETTRLQPDVVLLDLNLPNVSSICACEEIKRANPHTSVIVITGGLDPNLRSDVLAAGASAVIEKGAAPAELLAAIAAAQARKT